MAEFHPVAKKSEIPEGGAICVTVEGKSVALFNLGGEIYALADECTHEEGPLSEGEIEGDEVECPWHMARFNIKTGKVLCEPACEDVATYPVRVVGDDVEVAV
ncbi:MAG: non-heme iron oxygenase ferredoxin subunit [Acidobacteria bacterium]|nr:MAG: non-heme iron oxygenase ferredoxin subunit [Acidobacteriota bacterium]